MMQSAGSLVYITRRDRTADKLFFVCTGTLNCVSPRRNLMFLCTRKITCQPRIQPLCPKFGTPALRADHLSLPGLSFECGFNILNPIWSGSRDGCEAIRALHPIDFWSTFELVLVSISVLARAAHDISDQVQLLCGFYSVVFSEIQSSSPLSILQKRRPWPSTVWRNYRK